MFSLLISGVSLNSVYDGSQGCCVQFIQCAGCDDGHVVGARVLLADSTSNFKTGQVCAITNMYCINSKYSNTFKGHL